MLLRLYLQRRICLVELDNPWRSRRDRFGKELLFSWPDVFCLSSVGFSLSSLNLSSLPGACRCWWNVCVSCRALTFVYPFGATLNVMRPAVAILSTGSVCFPLNRPILAFYQHEVWAAWGTPCIPPAPHKDCEWIFQGYLKTLLSFWCICKLQMSPVTPHFMVNFFPWGSEEN